MASKNKFIVYPKNWRDGLAKRGVNQQRKNKSTGKVEKGIKNPTGCSSSVGWGVVDDTIIKVKKDLDFSKGKQEMLISQLKRNYLEQEPPKKKRLYVKEPDVSVVVPLTKELTNVPPLIVQWYQECEENLKKGTIGLVPECFQNQLPPWEEFLCTNIGKTMISFSKFAKRMF
jgi:hypothetical protein